jgi:PAS domain-containing protein
VVTASIVRRVLGIEGLDRLVSIFRTREAAIAAGTPGTDVPVLARARAQTNGHQRPRWGNEPGATAIAPAVLWQLIDSLGDGLALTGDDGQIVMVNRQLADMFGYEHAELIGRPLNRLFLLTRGQPTAGTGPPTRGTTGAADGHPGPAGWAAQGRSHVSGRSQS